jgi:Uma2 family endonuclease
MTMMNPAAVPPATFTPEDLLAMPDAVSFELVGGRLVERKMSVESSRIGMRVGYLLLRSVDGTGLGDVLGADASYQCFPHDPGKVRKPDVSFIRAGRLPDEQRRKGHARIAPDLAVEVTSPNDLVDEVADKVVEYIDAGVRLVWVVYPTTRRVVIHRPPGAAGGPISEVGGEDVITGEDVVPGFSCPVSEFFARG